MSLLDQLSAIVGARYVATDPGVIAGSTTDWTGRYSGAAMALVRPRTTEEVAAVMSACTRVAQPVLPQGGNTGLVGASVPNDLAGRPPVILSMTRINEIGEVDQSTGQLTAGAGATLASVRAAATASGWEYGVDLAARDSATVGGTLATNAGGIRVCAFGMTRAQVVGITAVLADGSIIRHLGGLPKDNTGYDLTGLLVGSEGTLAIITAARLRLHRPPGSSVLALVGVPDYADAQALIRRVTANGERLLAAEVMQRNGVELLCQMTGLPLPLAQRSWRHLVLLEVEADAIDLPGDCDAVVAQDVTDTQRLWRYREEQAFAACQLGRPGTLHKLDVSVPARRWQRFSDQLAAVLDADPTVSGWTVFGHLADGNLHVQVGGPELDDVRTTEVLLGLVADHGGSISAEHGIGRAKAKYLRLSRSTAEIATMRAIKGALDPAGLLSPGVVFV